MTLMQAGYFPATYFSDYYWQDDFWAEAGEAIVTIGRGNINYSYNKTSIEYESAEGSITYHTNSTDITYE